MLEVKLLVEKAILAKNLSHTVCLLLLDMYKVFDIVKIRILLEHQEKMLNEDEMHTVHTHCIRSCLLEAAQLSDCHKIKKLQYWDFLTNHIP